MFFFIVSGQNIISINIIPLALIQVTDNKQNQLAVISQNWSLNAVILTTVIANNILLLKAGRNFMNWLLHSTCCPLFILL